MVEKTITSSSEKSHLSSCTTFVSSCNGPCFTAITESGFGENTAITGSGVREKFINIHSRVFLDI